MRWRPHPEHAAAWSAAGGVVTVVGASSAVLLAIKPSSAHVPAFVIYGCGLLALLGFYGMLAPLLRLWPWTSVSPADRKSSSAPVAESPLEDGPRETSATKSSTVATAPISLVSLEELLAEGDAMLQDANAIHVVMHGSSEYGPPTNAKIDSWKRRVSQSLPETYRRRFQFPPRELPAGEVIRLLVHGHEQKEVRRLRRHVEVLKHFLEEMLDDQPQPQTESLDAWLDSRALDMRKLGDRLQELLAKTPFNGERARSIQVSFLQVNDDVLTRLHTDGPEWAAELFMENPSGVPLELTLVTSNQFRRYMLPLVDATIDQVTDIRAGLREGHDEP